MVVKNMPYELLRKLIKEEITIGEAEKIPRVELIENALGKLAYIDNPTYNTQIEKYRETKEKLLNQMDTINREMNKIIDEYYNALLKDL